MAPARRALLFDAALVAVLAAIGIAGLVVAADPDFVGPAVAGYSRAGAGILLALQIAPLPLRRRFPLTVTVVVLVAFSVFRIQEQPEFTASAVALFIALYSAGAYGGRWRQWIRGGAAVTIVALVAWDLVRSAEEAPDGKVVVLTLLSALSNAFYLAAAWFLGDLVRTRREREAVLVAQAAALEQARAAEARQAVLGERVRIARELHDVLAHHVSVMGVQAGAARRVLDSRPDAVPELLASIESSSREAVGELQRMLGLLRQDGDDPAEGHASLRDLEGLVRTMRDAGLDVTATVGAAVADGGETGAGDAAGGTGTAGEGSGAAELDLPAGVDVSAYRVVQEALTNTLKHVGPGARATVEVLRRPSSLEVRVVDDGRAARGGAASAPPGRPHEGDVAGARLGLLGMRERLSLQGGELRTGRTAQGGFEVRAWFPLRAGTPSSAGTALAGGTPPARRVDADEVTAR